LLASVEMKPRMVCFRHPRDLMAHVRDTDLRTKQTRDRIIAP
jgi:hypothetical protein